MSTPSTEPTTAAELQPTVETSTSSEGTLASVEATETEPGFVARHTSTLITLMLAVIVAALAIAGVMLYKNRVDDRDSATEAAFAEYIEGQGASVDTVECTGDTCAATIGTSAYTVLVQEDSEGDQHFGVSAYVGD